MSQSSPPRRPRRRSEQPLETARVSPTANRAASVVSTATGSSPNDREGHNKGGSSSQSSSRTPPAAPDSRAVRGSIVGGPATASMAASTAERSVAVAMASMSDAGDSERRQPAAAGRKLWVDPTAPSTPQSGGGSRSNLEGALQQSKSSQIRQRRSDKRVSKRASRHTSQDPEDHRDGRSLSQYPSGASKMALLNNPVILDRNATIEPSMLAPRHDRSGSLSRNVHADPPARSDLSTASVRSQTCKSKSPSPCAELSTPHYPVNASLPPSHSDLKAAGIGNPDSPTSPACSPTLDGLDRLTMLFPTLFSGPTSNSVKLLDENLQFHLEDAFKILSDYPGCFVIGVLGRAGVGKSTLLSSMTNSKVFPVQGHDRRSSLSETKAAVPNETCGVDLYVTPERVVFLDTQAVLPLQSSSTHARGSLYTHSGDARSQRSDPPVQTDSAKLSLFMVSVCHVILLVSDTHHDSELYRLIRNAESIRSTEASLSKSAAPMPPRQSSAPNIMHASSGQKPVSSLQPAPISTEIFWPHIALVYNKCKPEMLIPQSMCRSWKSFSRSFKNTDFNAFNLFSSTCLTERTVDFEKLKALRLQRQSAHDSSLADVSGTKNSMEDHDTADASIGNVYCLPYQAKPLSSIDLNLSLDELMSSSRGTIARFDVLVKQLRDILLGIPRLPTSTGTDSSHTSRHEPIGRHYMMSERDWIRSAARTWECIRKHDFSTGELYTGTASQPFSGAPLFSTGYDTVSPRRPSVRGSRNRDRGSHRASRNG
ncbi:hypothetical protein BASA62_001704 [Batrachochytrium salamandrivorans]|nr:hypothetical protein BASA62_001704 [Batrachochytrium salamandrivorans]